MFIIVIIIIIIIIITIIIIIIIIILLRELRAWRYFLADANNIFEMILIIF